MQPLHSSCCLESQLIGRIYTCSYYDSNTTTIIVVVDSDARGGPFVHLLSYGPKSATCFACGYVLSCKSKQMKLCTRYKTYCGRSATLHTYDVWVPILQS